MDSDSPSEMGYSNDNDIELVSDLASEISNSAASDYVPLPSSSPSVRYNDTDDVFSNA